MKTILRTVLASLVSLAALADGTVTLSEREVELNVDISTTKVKLSRADYSAPVVKVLVPDLADVTVLDHRNTGEGAPCLATYDTLAPEDVIQNNPVVERVKFKVTLQKATYLDAQAGVCHVSLVELVEGKIRGFNFVHDREVSVGSRHPDDCR